MAAQPEDTKTLPLFTTDEKQWLRTALQNTIQTIERSMGKYPPGSKMYDALAGDKSELAKLKEKLK